MLTTAGLSIDAAMPGLPDPLLAWEDLSAVDRRALTEILVDKIIIERHPSKIDKDGRRDYLIRAIPYQNPQQGAERLKSVHEARVKIVPRSEQQIGHRAKRNLNCAQLRSSSWVHAIARIAFSGERSRPVET